MLLVDVDCKPTTVSNDRVTLIDVELCGLEPMSDRDLVDELGGSQVSGYQRTVMHREVYEALVRFYDAACELEPTNEGAAALLLRMVARDVTFAIEPWMRELFAAHREALEELFHRPDAGRATDYGTDNSARDGDADGSGRRFSGATAKKRSVETLRAVAQLFLSGKVREAAQVAGVEVVELLRWQHTNPHFRAACRSALAAQDERLAAE